MARAKATRRKAAALDVECAQPPAANAIGDAPMEKTPTMPDAQGLEEQRMDRHHDRDHGGLGDRRAGLHVQEKFVIVVKNHYIIVQVPVVWEAPYWPSEAPPQGDAGPTCPLQPFGGVAECEAKHSSGGLVLEVVLASLAEVAVKARAAADSACSAEPGYVLANEPVPEDSEGSGKEISAVVGTIDLCDAIKLDDGAVGAMQHDEGEQYDEDRVGPVVAKLAPYAVATVCLRGIWVGEPWAWLWMLVYILGVGCRRKLRRMARLRGQHAVVPANVDIAFSLVIGSAVLGSILTGLVNNNDHMDFVGFISYKFGGVGVALILIFVSSGLVDLFGLGGTVGNWLDISKANLSFYFRQWGTGQAPVGQRRAA